MHAWGGFLIEFASHDGKSGHRFANSTSGVTWGGQTYETSDGKVQRDLDVQTVPISQGVDVHDTEAVILIFS